jgi:hypothetical protein
LAAAGRKIGLGGATELTMSASDESNALVQAFGSDARLRDITKYA